MRELQLPTHWKSTILLGLAIVIVLRAFVVPLRFHLDVWVSSRRWVHSCPHMGLLSSAPDSEFVWLHSSGTWASWKPTRKNTIMDYFSWDDGDLGQDGSPTTWIFECKQAYYPTVSEVWRVGCKIKGSSSLALSSQLPDFNLSWTARQTCFV